MPSRISTSHVPQTPLLHPIGTPDSSKTVTIFVPSGSFFGLLGPNGAGKSTTISILCCLIQATSGSVKIDGFDILSHPVDAKQALGVVPQEFNFNIFESCLQIVTNQAGYYGVPASVARPNAESLLKRLGLGEKLDTPAGRLSGGQKRRLMIARALVHQPKILILDEPTAGVDISLRRTMWEFLSEQNEAGLTIILTTHYLEEAEQLCDQLAIIDKGKIVSEGQTKTLLDSLSKETIRLQCLPHSTPPEVDGLTFEEIAPFTYKLSLPQSVSLRSLTEELARQDISVFRVQNVQNRLEELFLDLVESS